MAASILSTPVTKSKTETAKSADSVNDGPAAAPAPAPAETLPTVVGEPAAPAPVPAPAAPLVPVNATGLTIGGVSFKVKSQITRTVLTQIEGQPFAVTFQGEAYQGEELQQTKGGVKMAPARLAPVLNLETGELQLLIMNAVLEGELVRALPTGYVGKSFLIRGKKPEGKRYRVYEIAEIEVAASGVTGTVIADASDPVNRNGVAPGKSA